MKLSEAIRSGALLRPQAFGDYYDEIDDGVLATCALGAAYEAITGDLPINVDGDTVVETIREETAPWPQKTLDIPEIGRISDVLYAVDILNDNLQWSREDISAYLASQGF